MREFKLKNGQACLVDDEDYPILNAFGWRIDGTGRYAITRVSENGKRVVKLMHRFILGLTDPSVYADHLDRNTLNNCRSNLRVCDNSLNQANRLPNKNKTGRFKGVYWRPKKKAWVSEITRNGNRFYLGFFKSELDAAIAYNNKAKQLFGAFALLNPIQGVL